MKILITFIITFLIATNVLAKEQGTVVYKRETLREKIIGSFVKTFAKTYVATHNLDKFKEKNIRKIRKMDEAKFQRAYRRIYEEMVKDLPQHLKDMYGITKEMTREKAIARINMFRNKSQIYQMINAIPNKMIALHFKKHRQEFNKTMKESGTGVDGMVDQLLTDPGVS